MKHTRIATLVAAAVITAITAISHLQGWEPLNAVLRTITVGIWVIFAIAIGTDRIVAAITNLRQDIEIYGDQRNSDGIIDGLQRSTPAQQPATLTRIR